jgi:hypothetical protein
LGQGSDKGKRQSGVSQAWWGGLDGRFLEGGGRGGGEAVLQGRTEERGQALGGGSCLPLSYRKGTAGSPACPPLS